MANVKKYTDQIAKAQKGRDVRDAIVNAINAVSDENNEYNQVKTDILEAQTDITEKVAKNEHTEQIFAADVKKAEALKQGLDSNIEQGTALKGQLDTAVSTANTAKKNLDSANTTAAQRKTDLDGSISTAQTLKGNLESDISQGTTLKQGLDSDITQGTALKSQLDTTVSTANTAKKNLDDSNTAAGKTKTALDSSNATATQTKSGLDSSNKTASNLNTSLGEKITEGTKLQTDLQTTGETVVSNLQTEANKQIQNITAAGGGIENALSNFFALRRTGKVYTTRIYKYDTSTSPTGVKMNDNEGLVRKPSTNTVIGQDDYREIGVFMHFPCNFTVDDKGFNHVTALQGQPDFKKTGKVDVGEVTMSAWVGITDNPEYVDYHYSDSPNEALGLRPMGESINPDGTISPFMIHGKYGAGDIDGVPYSSAGLILANGSQKGGKPVSHTGLIAYMRKKGSMYVGTTNWDLFYKQLMMIILYATTNSRSVMTGCNSYTSQEMATVAETGVTRVILPKAKANNYIVGSYVSVGDIGSNTNKDRYYAYMHNLAYDVKILKIEPVDDTNSAIYLDTEPFNTTLTTCISTMPWRTGSTDSVLGSDGSPFSNTDNKNPFKIQGIETGYGAYEVLSNVFMDIVTDEDGTPKRDVYICMDASLLTTDMNAAKTRYKKVAAQVTYTAASWKYISKCFVDPALGIMVPTETKAGSTTGFCNGLYTDSGTSGQREWLSLGSLYHGAFCGLWILNASNGVGTANWVIVSGVSPNGTRGEWQAAA
ncbi:MAG: Macoilin family protein [Bacteriophage sp.]|nr:MAG: Macoilin family protein [Bacteriophage sp.]